MSIFSSFKPDIHRYGNENLLSQFQARTAPGSCSQVGFRGKEEHLADICKGDRAYLASRGITHEQIGDRLEAVLSKAQHLWSQYQHPTNRVSLRPPAAIIEGYLRVPYYLPTCGIQPCPFSEDLGNTQSWCGYSKSDIVIFNTKTAKALEHVTELHAHLIRDHHFFQGRGTPYRLEPSDAIDVLQLAPGCDYAMKATTEQVWQGVSFFCDFEETTHHTAEADMIEKYVSPCGHCKAYLLPYKEPIEINDGVEGDDDWLWAEEQGQETSPVEVKAAERFLHLFATGEVNGPLEITIGGGSLTEAGLQKGSHFIYGLKERRTPHLSDKDALESV